MRDGADQAGDNQTSTVGQNVLLEIIEAQTQIAKLGLDLGGVMTFVVDRVREMTGADSAVIELAEKGEMVYRAASGGAKSQLGLRLDCGTSLSGLCVAAGKVLVCADSESDLRVDRLACQRVGLRSMVVSPLLHNGMAVGVLKIGARKVDAFDDRHVQILRLMSDLIAAATFHAAKYETDELFYRATHDPLTGLANRALFYDHLHQGVALAARHTSRLCILNLDMDGLKQINDTHGHRAGDAAIKAMAERLSAASRRSDTVARLGGDEFGIIMPDVRDHACIEPHVDRIGTQIRAPFDFEGTALRLDASIGAALFPDDATDLEALIDRADQSMYRVKRARKGRRHSVA